MAPQLTHSLPSVKRSASNSATWGVRARNSQKLKSLLIHQGQRGSRMCRAGEVGVCAFVGVSYDWVNYYESALQLFKAYLIAL